MEGWLVARTRFAQERWACENIRRQAAEPYLPMILEQRLTNHRIMLQERCLFPGYVFVKTNGQWRFLLNTFGLLGVILSGAKPAVVAEKEISALRARENSAGYVVLPARASPPSRFSPGQRVRVAGGALSGYSGIYAGAGAKARQRVLLEFLGRKTPVLIGGEFLEG